MKQTARRKRLKNLSFGYLGGAVLTLIICFIDVILGGLFAEVQLDKSIGLAAVCTVAELAIVVLLGMIALDLSRKFTQQTLKKGLLLIAVSILTLLFCLFGGYNVIPSLLGLALPAITVFFIR